MKKILFMLMAILALTACSDDNVSDLNLSGGCSITELTLDNYDGTMTRLLARLPCECQRPTTSLI